MNSHWLQNVLSMNLANGKKTTTVRKQYSTETSRRLAQLKKNTWSTLGTNQIHLIVQTPPNENQTEWITMHVTDFFNEVGMFIEMVSDHEDADLFDAPGKGFPPGLVYRWKEEGTGQVVFVSGLDYMDFSLSYIENQLGDLSEPEDKINKGELTIDEFMELVQQMFTKMFRCYAILYGAFLPTLKKLEISQHLNTSFKHFVYFATAHELMPSGVEIRALESKVAQHQAQYQTSMQAKPPKQHLRDLYKKTSALMTLTEEEV